MKRARDLARRGDLGASADLFTAARAKGWSMATEPDRAAAELWAVKTLFGDDERPGSDEEAAARAAALDDALKRCPEMATGHRIAASFHEAGRDYAQAENHYREEARAREHSAVPLAQAARLAFARAEESDDESWTKKTLEYAQQALDRDPNAEVGWWFLAHAQYRLKEYKSAAEAFDRISPSSQLFTQALNFAGTLYFERLSDDHAAYQRFTRAVQAAPNDLAAVSNYAEFLVGLGRTHQARLTALRAREHPEIASAEHADVRVAMSFVVFCADVLLQDRQAALGELEEMQWQVEAVAERAREAAAAGNKQEGWSYRGISRRFDEQLKAWLEWQRTAILKALSFVESKGQEPVLQELRDLLSAEPKAVQGT